MLTYFSKDPLYYSESKYLIICCWKPCKNTSLYFWNTLVTSATVSLHPKWIMQWEVISFHGLAELESDFVTRQKSEGGVPGGEVFSGFFKVMLSWLMKWRSSRWTGLFASYPGLELSTCWWHRYQVKLYRYFYTSETQTSWEIASETDSSDNAMSSNSILEKIIFRRKNTARVMGGACLCSTG